MTRHCHYTNSSPATPTVGDDDEFDQIATELLLAEHTIADRDQTIELLQAALRAEQEGRERDRQSHEEIVEQFQNDLSQAHGERIALEADLAASDARLSMYEEDIAAALAIIEAKLPSVVLHTSTSLFRPGPQR